MRADPLTGRRASMTAASTQPRALYVSTIYFAAVLTAVPCARVFTRQALKHWNLADHLDEAELIVSELVGNAVKATGITDAQPKSWQVKAYHVIGVQLRIVDTCLYIEVWDNDDTPPVQQEPTLDGEGGRGLILVEALSVQWDIYRAATGGKVVWAQVALTKQADPSESETPLPRRVPGATDPPDGPVKEMATMALMQRVRDGLRAMDDRPSP